MIHGAIRHASDRGARLRLAAVTPALDVFDLLHVSAKQISRVGVRWRRRFDVGVEHLGAAAVRRRQGLTA